MDETDGYTLSEREDGGDEEPALAATMMEERFGQYAPASDDREVDDSEHEDSLGSLASSETQPQTIWAHGRSDDLEDSGLGNDDREEVNEDGDSDPDKEPSIGWTAFEASTGRYTGYGEPTADLEEDAGSMPECDPAENGIADSDGLLEQCGGLYPNGIGTVAAYARAAI